MLLFELAAEGGDLVEDLGVTDGSGFFDQLGETIFGVFDEFAVDVELGHRGSRELELVSTEKLLADGHETARSGFFLGGVLGDLPQRLVLEIRLDAVGFEFPLVLPDQASLGIFHDLEQVFGLEMIADDADGQAPDELRLESKFDEVLRRDRILKRFGIGIGSFPRSEPDRALADALLDDFLQSGKRPAHDEKNVSRVDRVLSGTTATVHLHHCLHLRLDVLRIANGDLGLLHQLE